MSGLTRVYPPLLLLLPHAGCQLMQIVGRAALVKQLDNVARKLAERITPAIQWTDTATADGWGDDESTDQDASFVNGKLPSVTEHAEGFVPKESSVHGSPSDIEGALALDAMLSEKGFDRSEVDMLTSIAKFSRFKARQRLVHAGHPWPYIMFVLRGSLWLERWQLEAEEGAQVGTVEYFERPHIISPAPGVIARSEGIVAGIPYKAIDRLLSKNGTLGHKLLLLLGQFSIALCNTSIEALAELEANPPPPPPATASSSSRAPQSDPNFTKLPEFNPKRRATLGGSVEKVDVPLPKTEGAVFETFVAQHNIKARTGGKQGAKEKRSKSVMPAQTSLIENAKIIAASGDAGEEVPMTKSASSSAPSPVTVPSASASPNVDISGGEGEKHYRRLHAEALRKLERKEQECNTLRLEVSRRKKASSEDLALLKQQIENERFSSNATTTLLEKCATLAKALFHSLNAANRALGDGLGGETLHKLPTMSEMKHVREIAEKIGSMDMLRSKASVGTSYPPGDPFGDAIIATNDLRELFDAIEARGGTEGAQQHLNALAANAPALPVLSAVPLTSEAPPLPLLPPIINDVVVSMPITVRPAQGNPETLPPPPETPPLLPPPETCNVSTMTEPQSDAKPAAASKVDHSRRRNSASVLSMEMLESPCGTPPVVTHRRVSVSAAHIEPHTVPVPPAASPEPYTPDKDAEPEPEMVYLAKPAVEVAKVKHEGKRKTDSSKGKADKGKDHGSSSSTTALGGLRARAPSVADSPYPAFTIMQSSEMILTRGGGSPHDAEIAAFIGTTSHDHFVDAKQLAAAADAPAGINPSALRKAAFALGLGGPDKRPKLKPLMQRPHTSAELSALRALEMATAAAGSETETLAAGMTGGNAHPSTPSVSKMSARDAPKGVHVSPDRPGAGHLSHPPSLSLPASNKPSPRPPPRGPWTRSPRAETARGASDMLGADDSDAFQLEASNMPSFLGALRPAELSALSAQLQAQQLMAYARSTMQQARSGAAARAASRGNLAQTTGVLPRRQLSSRVL